MVITLWLLQMGVYGSQCGPLILLQRYEIFYGGHAQISCQSETTCARKKCNWTLFVPYATNRARHGNLGPTREYLARPDPLGFFLKKKKKTRTGSRLGPGFIKTRSEPDPFIYKITYIPSYIYIVLNPNLRYSSSALAPLLFFSSHKHSRLNP